MNGIITATLIVAQATAPAERPCILPEEAGAMAVAVLPILIDSAVIRCQPHLAADSFLASGAATDWSARLRRDAEPHRELALSAIGKFGGVEAPSGASDEATFDFVARLAFADVANEIQPAWCGDLDTLARSLAPLPSENLVDLVTTTVRFVALTEADQPEAEEQGRDGRPNEAEDDGPPICRL